ncbi:MAG: hypothetical protein ACI81S_002216 [Sphingobacteriales bacterium]|jgi:hypothetical protein
MKRIILSIIIISMVSMYGCKSKQKLAENNNLETSENTVETITSGPEEEKTMLASIERTPCYGECPVYKMTIFTNGDALYEGRMNVEMEGLHTGVLSRRSVKKIIELAEDIKFFDFDENYIDEYITDIPSTIVTFVKDGNRKTIRSNSFQTPKELISFQNFIDQMGKDAEWDIED